MPNKRVVIIITTVVVGLLIIGSLRHRHHHPQTQLSDGDITMPTDAASGDTNTEVLRQLSAQLKQVKQHNADNAAALAILQKQPVTQLPNTLHSAQQHLQYTVKQEQAKLQHLIDDIAELKHTLTEGNTHTEAHFLSFSEDNPVAQLSIPPRGMITRVLDLSQQLAGNTTLTSTVNRKQPMTTPSKPSSTVGFSNAMDSTYQPSQSKPAKITPYYTIPAISNLANTTLLTALIGEVPDNGQLIQPPFPFEAITGRDDLIAANGIDLPAEITGMKVYGYSLGVGSFLDNLSCVRAYITKALFVFEDGHYVITGNQQDVGSQVNPSDTLGYLTDSYGNPCIPGKFITNAPRVLSALATTSALSGAADAMSQAQTTISTDESGATSTLVDGSIMKYALGNGVSHGMSESAKWLLNRIKGSFDVVYIPASKDNTPIKLVINITKTLTIDKDANGRLLQYDNTSHLRAGLPPMTTTGDTSNEFD